MAHGYFSNLPRGTASKKILHDEALVISKYPKYDRYQQGLAVTVYTFFGKMCATHKGTRTNSDAVSDKLQLAIEFNKPTI